jgi:hypothetical protein
MKRYLLVVALAASVLLVPLAAYSQTTLTGAMLFSTTSAGAWNNYSELNTVGGDNWWDLWLALNPDGTSPVNGPTDAQAGISIPLQLGKSYKYYFFASGPCCTSSQSFNALNLFFNSNSSTPGISAFGALNNPNFLPNSNTTITLEAAPVAGSGTSFYNSGSVIVVLGEYVADEPATPPGNVAQPFEFSPGDSLSFFGSFSLQVWPAAALSLSQADGSSEAKITLSGSGFAPTETIEIYAGHIGLPPLFTTTTTDTSGAFTVAAREPQHPFGPMDVYAVGVSSRKLGAATLFVTPDLAMNPASGAPGGSTTAYGFGFGSGETVDIYWNSPRQLLGTATANGKGSGALAIAIPQNASPGINVVIGVGQTTNAIGVGEVRVQ